MLENASDIPFKPFRAFMYNIEEIWEQYDLFPLPSLFVISFFFCGRCD